jgi:hypothetical protein
MSLPALDNLLRIGQLKAEPRNDAGLARMLAASANTAVMCCFISSIAVRCCDLLLH